MNNREMEIYGQNAAQELQQGFGLLVPPARHQELARLLVDLELEGSHGGDSLLDELSAKPALQRLLLAKLTVAESYFFRCPDQFRYIRNQVIPHLLKLRGPDHVFRLWSAGCAKGEEAYSLAMLFAEAGLLERTEVTATDINEEALEAAREGCYSAWSLRDEGQQLAGPYLDREGRHYRVLPAIRDAVNFTWHNLAETDQPYEAPYCGFDLVLCRNLLIYTGSPQTEQICSRQVEALLPGGYLINAPVDPLPGGLKAEYCMVPGVGQILHKPFQQEELRSAAPQPGAAAESIPKVADFPVKLRPLIRDGGNPRNDPEAESGLVTLLEKSIGRGDFDEAIRLSPEALAADPEDRETRFRHALLLLGRKRFDEARDCLRQLLYLDRDLAIAHFTLATVRVRLGDRTGAAKSFQHALTLCEACDADSVLVLSATTTAGQLIEAIRHEMAKLDYREVSGNV